MEHRVDLSLHHARELVDTLRVRGYEELANALEGVDEGGSITIHVGTAVEHEEEKEEEETHHEDE